MHPALSVKSSLDNDEAIHYQIQIDFEGLPQKASHKHGIDHLIFESAGTPNAALLPQALIDPIILIVAPLLIGGQMTSTLTDGPSLQTEEDLKRPLAEASVTWWLEGLWAMTPEAARERIQAGPRARNGNSQPR